MSKHDPYINKLIFTKYLIRKKVGKGSFGTVYQGINTATNEKIALKVEKREKNDQGTLENEALRLVYLQGEGIPKFYCYGNNLAHNLLVEELLGKSLEDIFNSYGKPFSLKTVCVLGIEMIKRVQYIHSKYYIHRDIKPDNFMVGRGINEKKIYIIDFGLAKKYYSVSKLQHIKFCTGKHLIGTARYCGRNAHRGYEQGRRDDIESIGYVLMYFLLGVLPWQGLKVKKNEDQFEKIAQKKYTTSFEELTYGKPEEFLLYFKHCDHLNFEDQPNYEYLIGLFQNIIDRYCRDCIYDFDWKKDYCTHFSKEIKENNKSIDVSLIVNKNNDASAIDYSYDANDDDETNENGNENKKNKKFLKKELFYGEDKQYMDNDQIGENLEDNYLDKLKKRPQRSQSMVNLKKLKKNKKLNNEAQVNNNNNINQFGFNSIKKAKRNTQFFPNINNFNKQNNISNNIGNNNINNNNNNEDNNDDNNTCGFNINGFYENNEQSKKDDNNDNNDNNNNNDNNDNNDNIDNDNINSIQSNQSSSKNDDNNKYNSYVKKRKSMIRNDISNNDYIPGIPAHLRKSRISNITGLQCIDPNKFHFDYKEQEITNNENEKNDNKDDMEPTGEEDMNTKDKDNIDDNYWDDMNSIEEEGNKKKKRNRNNSVDDKKYKNDNVKCNCFIF